MPTALTLIIRAPVWLRMALLVEQRIGPDQCKERMETDNNRENSQRRADNPANGVGNVRRQVYR